MSSTVGRNHVAHDSQNSGMTVGLIGQKNGSTIDREDDVFRRTVGNLQHKPTIKTKRAETTTTALPKPSREQRNVIQAVSDGWCVSVKACAGSGKTTCMLQVASNLPIFRKVLIITYNRCLKDECIQKIQKLQLMNRVSCYTIHGLVTSIAGKTCNDDKKLIQTLNEWEKKGNLESKFNSKTLDLVMLDEAQDIRPLYHKLLSYIFKRSNKYGIQLCLVGDPVSL